MARQTWAQLATLLADNTAGAISAADLRAAVIDTMRPNEAAADPTASDDDTSGFDVGHRWRNTTSGRWFRCVDGSTGAAVWEPEGSSGGVAWGEITGTLEDQTDLGTAIADFVTGDGITDVIAKTQAEYDGLTPVTGVLYVITDA